MSKYIPNVELHRHFEAGMSPKVLSSLAIKNDIKKIVDRKGNVISNENPQDPEAIKRFYQSIGKSFDQENGFNTFDNSFGLPLSVINSLEDLTYIAYEQLIEQQKESSIHTELRGSPYSYKNGIEEKVSLIDVIRAIQKGLDKAWKRKKMSSTFILQFSRQKHEKYANRVLNTALELYEEGILIGIDIAGSPEHLYPPSIFEDMMQPIIKAGMPITIHAGEQGKYPHFETSPPKFVRDAILKLKARRIGHGTSVISDKSVMNLVKKERVCLECCPLSNELLGFITLENHPLKKFLDESLLATISTDDPLMFGINNVRDIYSQFGNRLNLTVSDFMKLTENGIKCSFVTDERKKYLLNKFKICLKKKSIRY